jgi:ribonucleoside-diphosphate reductase beta chain
MEPLLDPKNSRTALFPIQYEDIWTMYKQAVAAFWVPEEISLSQDVTDFTTLDENEQHFILMVLAFFANSDFIVNENLDEDFCDRVAVPELKLFYHYQLALEDIHSVTYQTLIETLVTNRETKENLLNSVMNIPSIKAKAEWARRWIKEGDWVQRLVAFSCVEGIFFSASFCSIFWLKKKGLLPGLAHSNELISRDEGMHRDMYCLLYRRYIQFPLPREQLEAIIKDAVEVEKQFVKDTLPYRLSGMNSELMCQYVEYVADHLLAEMGQPVIYKTENPFQWMQLISMNGKNNFFEKKVSQYAKQNVITSTEERTIRFDAEF